jgi:hypothetical protein
MRELTDERVSSPADPDDITTVCWTKSSARVQKQEVETMQNVNTIMRRPVPIGSAAASALLAFVAGAVIALGVPAVAVGFSASHTSNATVSVGTVGGELISHNRSEAGLDVSNSVAGDQISHNRSEEGLG